MVAELEREDSMVSLFDVDCASRIENEGEGDVVGKEEGKFLGKEGEEVIGLNSYHK